MLKAINILENGIENTESLFSLIIQNKSKELMIHKSDKT